MMSAIAGSSSSGGGTRCGRSPAPSPSLRSRREVMRWPVRSASPPTNWPGGKVAMTASPSSSSLRSSNLAFEDDEEVGEIIARLEQHLAAGDRPPLAEPGELRQGIVVEGWIQDALEGGPVTGSPVAVSACVASRRGSTCPGSLLALSAAWVVDGPAPSSGSSSPLPRARTKGRARGRPRRSVPLVVLSGVVSMASRTSEVRLSGRLLDKPLVEGFPSVLPLPWCQNDSAPYGRSACSIIASSHPRGPFGIPAAVGIPGWEVVLADVRIVESPFRGQPLLFSRNARTPHVFRRVATGWGRNVRRGSCSPGRRHR